ncbi:MAG TPA: hypothetical protein VN903_26785 [Polyangia bacterium]|nr:hypothetical protein [Polyangia bacterium]
MLLGLASVGLAGCPGSLDPHLKGGGGTAGTGGGACDAPAMVFDSKPNGKCTTLGCHDAMFKSGGLDLTNDAGLLGRLLDKLPDGTNSSVCGGTTTPYLVSGSMPAQGLLLDKMFANPLPCGGAGNRMPSLGTLTQQDTDCIHAWANDVTAP